MSSILKVDTIQNTGGTTGLTINSSGFVATKVPILNVVLTSNTTTYSSNNYHLIDFSTYGTVEVDNTNAWDSTNEKWTPQTAGYYSVSCTLGSGAGTIRAAGPSLYKNGSLVQHHQLWLGSENDGDDINVSFTTIIHLNGSTDYIQMYGYIYDSSAGNDIFLGDRRTQMSAHFISTQDKQMTDIATALNELGVTEWVLRGEPTTQVEFETMFRKIMGADSNGSAIESADPSHFGTTWGAVKAKKDALVAAEPMRLLREERNRRLAEVDWWASSDLTMTDAQKKYRTDLRDITKTATSLDDVTWPTKPE